jgi:transposase
MLTKQTIASFKNASKKIPKHKKRAFQAQIAKDYLDGVPARAEKIFGWGRKTVALGLKELETGIKCIDDYSTRGRKKTEDQLPKLKEDIDKLISGKSQADPKFKTKIKYCQISAKVVCEKLAEKKKYAKKNLKVRTMNDVLNRLGYSLKKL